MDVAIIGAGNVGRALSTAIVRAGHSVTVSSNKAEDARALAAETGAEAADDNLAAVAKADAVVLAVPYAALDGLLGQIGSALDGRIVVDATNRVDPQDPGSVLDGTSAAEQIQARVPGARVVKAFNTLFAARQADPVVGDVELDGFVASDDESATSAVLELVRSMGLRPLDAGPLVMARALEAMALLNIMLQIRNNWSWQSGWKLIGPTA
jgi:8-hydroxy-5-deazaflavin:NADPH oxidoreductase